MIIVNVAWNNCFRNFFNACWRESAKPLLYYCNTMSASPLIDQRKILFYKKTICWSNVVLRTVCSLYVNDIQRLSSAYNILLWHMSYIDVKRTFWSFFYFIPVNLVCSLCLFLLCVSACAAFWRNKDWLIDIAFWQLASERSGWIGASVQSEVMASWSTYKASPTALCRLISTQRHNISLHAHLSFVMSSIASIDSTLGSLQVPITSQPLN